MDFEEERILRRLLLKGRYLGQRHVPPHRPTVEKAPHSQSHTWLAGFAMAQYVLWPLKTLLGVGKGLDWQRLSLRVWEHLYKGAMPFDTTIYPALQSGSLMNPSIQEKWSQSGKGCVAKTQEQME